MTPTQKFMIEIQERFAQEYSLAVEVTPVSEEQVHLLYKGEHPVHGPYEMESSLEVCEGTVLSKAILDLATSFSLGPRARLGFTAYQNR